tara:strand:+ start:1152 stop:1988 length:837 start_codon:yes stop_codon:yes gene_type:complete
MNSDYRILKLRSGEELITKIVGQEKDSMIIERPFLFKNSLMVDGYGRKKEITLLRNWLSNSTQIRVKIPKNHVALFLDPDDDISNLYEMEMEREDVNPQKRQITKKDDLFPPTFPPVSNDTQQNDLDSEIKKALENLSDISEEELRQQIDEKIQELVDTMEDNYDDLLNDMELGNEKYNGAFPPDNFPNPEQEQEFIILNMIFPPKIIKDMVDKGLLNVNDLNNIMGSESPKNNGEGFTDKYTGDDTSREDHGNEFTDWSWDISDYLDIDDNESDKSK